MKIIADKRKETNSSPKNTRIQHYNVQITLLYVWKSFPGRVFMNLKYLKVYLCEYTEKFGIFVLFSVNEKVPFFKFSDQE